MGQIIDLVGKKFCRWTVLRMGVKVGKHFSWECICECGTERLVSGPSLRNGTSTSCGCRRAEVSKQTFKTHGMANTRLNKVWSGMKARCSNPKHIAYSVYGARGITVCDRWQLFENFFADMSSTYKPGLTLDRIDNEKGYSFENCRWATYLEQAANKRRKLMLIKTGQGEMTVNEAAKIAGISARTMRARISLGYSAERLLSPLRARS